MTLIFVSLVDAYWHLVAYSCISLITNEIECHMVYLLTIWFSSFIKYLFYSSVRLFAPLCPFLVRLYALHILI